MPSPIPHDWGAAPCLDLINSRWRDHLGSGVYYDRMPEPRFRRAFISRWHYRVGDPDDSDARAHLVSLRKLLRDILERYAAGESISRSLQKRLDMEINRAPVALRLTRASEGYELAMDRSGGPWDVVTSEIATSAARLMAEQASVKVCANPDCSWMFMDETKAMSRRWCNVSVCGSLINVRRLRRQRAARHD